MAKKRTPMNKIKEILRLKYECGLSYRSIASCLNVSLATVSELVARFKQSQIGWPLPEGCSDTDLTKALYHSKQASRDKVMPDFAQYAVELKRKGMTKMLLWQEYHEQYQEQAYAYT
ncbi:helix-turn-helix domain-containing protein, partial [Vibrio parahaemolyticus]|nr:helix-turn-helix domain-containing protein [Vibrio parahaemolyticus]